MDTVKLYGLSSSGGDAMNFFDASAYSDTVARSGHQLAESALATVHPLSLALRMYL